MDTPKTNLAFLDVPGEMAALMREKNWAETPFGPIETWSPALRSAVGICLGSRFPIVLYWGPTRALIYNDAWSPVPGRKHPWALGRAGTEVWAEIWDIIGPMFDHVMDRGEATWSNDQLLPLNRFGYVEECYFYYSYSPVRGEDGTVEGIFTAVTETTYRVLAERRERLLRGISEATAQARTAADACAAAIERFASMPEEAPFCLAYLRGEATGRLERVGLSRPDLGGDLAPATIDPTADATPWPFAEALRTGLTAVIGDLAETFDHRLPGAPWPEAVEQAIVTPILSTHADAPHGFLVAGISPRRRVDDDYRMLFERAAGHVSTAIANAEAYEEERRRAEKLAELDRAKTAFFSNASHEFRTPLTLMLGPVDDMLERSVGDPVTVSRQELDLVRRNGQRLLRLVNSLLDFSRIEAGRVEAVFEPTELSAYTADLASTFRSAMERAGLAYRIDCEALAAPVCVDREMWEKIVLNLVSNAFKYTLEGGVTVRLRDSSDGATLTVEDTGVGIPEAERERVFERFHRIEGQVGRTHEGTGIGLALVKDLVGLHGGTVSVASTLGRGTTFTVQVPARPPADRYPALAAKRSASTATRADTFVSEALRWLPDAEPVSGPGDDRPATPARANGERIVLADDNADMRAYVERLLTEAGYRVVPVADGAEALARIGEIRPDLVLSDVMMPRLDGFGLIQALRADPGLRELPIILLSARAGEEASVEGIEAGADDYLVKPFSARELLARVEGALRLNRLRRETSESLRIVNEELERRVAERTRERDETWKNSRDLIGIADEAGFWRAVNPAWTATLGWAPEEIVGRTSEWMEHPDDGAKTRSEVQNLAGGKTTLDFENRFRTRAGIYRTLSWTAVPRNGLLYCVARDVTEERERAAELAQTRAALAQSQKMEAVGQLTGGIAHDFNNMLAGIIGSMDLLKRRVEQGRIGDIGRYIDAATTSANRAAALTARLLAFGRRQSLDTRPTDLNHLVGGLEDLLKRTLGESVSLETILQADLWPALTDANQFESALLNMAINARDAMPSGGKLTIETRNARFDAAYARRFDELEAGDYVSVSVSDTGTGMSPETVARAFEPFFTTKPLGQGTGLGLSMIYGFAKQAGGHVRIYSELGRGTSVSLYMPRLVVGAEESRESEAHGAAEIPRGEGERVLVVEDDPALRMLVLETLADLGYRAAEAEDARAAIARLEERRRFDLLITDVGLPNGMNGRQLAEVARVKRPDLPVLFITGYAEGAAVRGGFLDPGMEMITKPFALDVLATRIREMIAGGDP